MGVHLSRVIDDLHQLPAEKRLDGLTRAAEDKQLWKILVKGAREAGFRITKTKEQSALQPFEENPTTWKPSEEQVKEWASDVSKFWTSPAWKADFETGRLADVYDNCLRFVNERAVDVLRKRFLLIFFVDLLQLFFPHSRNVPKGKFDTFVEFFANGSNCDVKNIAAHLKDWISRGRRYNKLTQTFGNGVLVELPIDVSIDWLEVSLHLDDDKYKREIGILKHLNLKRRARDHKSDELATEIRRHALRSFYFISEKPDQYNPRESSMTFATDHQKSIPECPDSSSSEISDTPSSKGAEADGLAIPDQRSSKRRRMDAPASLTSIGGTDTGPQDGYWQALVAVASDHTQGHHLSHQGGDIASYEEHSVFLQPDNKLPYSFLRPDMQQQQSSVASGPPLLMPATFGTDDGINRTEGHISQEFIHSLQNPCQPSTNSTFDLDMGEAPPMMSTTAVQGNRGQGPVVGFGLSNGISSTEGVYWLDGYSANLNPLTRYGVDLGVSMDFRSHHSAG